MANNFCSNGNTPKGLSLFEDIIESMDRYYTDEHEKMRMYTMVLYNYSTFLGRNGRYRESIEAANKGEELDIKHGKLSQLPNFYINRACCMLETGDKENSLPYFALAYYGFSVLSRLKEKEIVRNYAIKHCDIDFTHPHHPPAQPPR